MLQTYEPSLHALEREGHNPNTAENLSLFQEVLAAAKPDSAKVENSTQLLDHQTGLKLLPKPPSDYSLPLLNEDSQFNLFALEGFTFWALIVFS